MNKAQLLRLVLEMISAIDEILEGEGEQAVGQSELHECRKELLDLAGRLRIARAGEVVDGAEVILVASRVLRLAYEWVREG